MSEAVKSSTLFERLGNTAIFFAIVTLSALCLSFILSVVIYRFGVPDHPQKYLVTSLYVAFCVALPIAVIASQNQFRLMAHRDPLDTLSSVDSLTGLLTRRFFLQAANQMIQNMNRSEKLSGLIVFDIDGFKPLNDAFGSNEGDRVLAAISTIAREQLRSRQDLITRWWGDEFVIALYNSTPDQTRIVAERIRARVEQAEIELQGQSVKVTASFGYAPLTKYDSLELALSRADEAMNHAKQHGRNTVQAWSVTKLAA